MKLFITFAIFTIFLGNTAFGQSWSDKQQLLNEQYNLEAELSQQRDETYSKEQRDQKRFDDMEAEVERMRYSSVPTSSQPYFVPPVAGISSPPTNYKDNYGLPLPPNVSEADYVQKIRSARKGSHMIIDDEYMRFLQSALLKRGRNHIEAKQEVNEYKLLLYETEDKAEAGHNNSEKILGDLYMGDMGIKKDAKLAVKWYSIAASRGNKEAEAILKNAILRMRRAQR